MIIKPIELCNKDTINKCEKHWIAELNTVYPYGLNMDATFKGVKMHTSILLVINLMLLYILFLVLLRGLTVDPVEINVTLLNVLLNQT